MTEPTPLQIPSTIRERSASLERCAPIQLPDADAKIVDRVHDRVRAKEDCLKNTNDNSQKHQRPGERMKKERVQPARP